MTMKPTDEEIAAKIKAECSHGDFEGAHCRADEILTQLLLALGYHQTVSAWDDVGKWYA